MAEPDLLAPLAGALLVIAVLGAVGPPGVPTRLRGPCLRAVRSELRLAHAALPGVDWRLVVGAEAGAGCATAAAAWAVTGLPAVAAASGVAAAAGTRIGLQMRGTRNRRLRQDAVLESVRMLRGLLESGGVGVQQGLAVLADRGPASLRAEFAAIVAAGVSGRQAREWAAARARLADPLFDMLSAAVLVQRPSGGALAPLFADLEESVSGIREVTREAEALQVQARSAAALVVVLPLVFLLVLAALRSPYLDAYRGPTGSAFLLAMLVVIGSSYAWVLRWLRLPEEPRLEVSVD